MNRLQKKCVIATAGCHLLLLVILFLGPAFFWHKPVTDNLPILKVIPSTAVDAALSSGVAHPTPPPAPQPPTPTPPQPEPPQPQPVVTPPPPVQEPVRQVEPKPEEVTPPDDKPSDVPIPVTKPKPKHSNIEVDISKPVERTVTHHHPDTTTQDDAAAKAEARAEARAEKKREQALHRLTASLNDGLSSSTDVVMPGDSSQSYANYGQIVKSIYETAWIPPDSADNDEANPKVHVVIARDGSVISAEIIEPSGDAAVDASVRRVLERVKFIQAFPDGAKEEQRSYNINFNLKAKRMTG